MMSLAAHYDSGWQTAFDKVAVTIHGSPNVSPLPLAKASPRKAPTRTPSFMRTSGTKITSPGTPDLNRSVSYGDGKSSQTLGGSGTADGFNHAS